MSQNIYFSKSISLAELRTCKQLKIGRQRKLYGNLDIATYKISHKNFPKEYAYIIFDDYKDDNIQKAIYGQDCENCTFCELENHFESVYHILLVLSGTFDIKFTYDIEDWSVGNFLEFDSQPCKTDKNEFAPKFTGENAAFELKDFVIPQLADNKIDFSNTNELQPEKPMSSPNLTDEEYYGKICSTPKIDLFT